MVPHGKLFNMTGRFSEGGSLRIWPSQRCRYFLFKIGRLMSEVCGFTGALIFGWHLSCLADITFWHIWWSEFCSSWCERIVESVFSFPQLLVVFEVILKWILSNLELFAGCPACTGSASLHSSRCSTFPTPDGFSCAPLQQWTFSSWTVFLIITWVW